MNIEIHIKELVLDGLEPTDRNIFRETVERELTRLFTERGLPSLFASSGEIANLNGESFDTVIGSTPEYIGVQVAQAVYRGFR